MGLLIVFALFFFINPLLTIGLGFMFIASFSENGLCARKDEVLMVKALGVMCVLYLSCINAQKIPESDLLTYINQYHHATNSSLINYLSEFNKEPVFYALTWLLNRVLFNNEMMYKFIMSALCYSFLNVAVYKFCKALGGNVKLTIFGLFLMNFTPYIFTSSMHLLRQYLAGAIMIYVLVDVFFYNRKNWLLIIMMVFVHSTTFFFIPFLFLKQLKKPFKKHASMYLLPFVLLFSIQILTSFLYSLAFFNQSFLGYALVRASKSTTFDLGRLPVMGIAFLVLLLSLSWYISYRIINRFHNMRGGIKHFFNILIILCIFILINLHQSELANRFLFFTYFFLPFMAVVLLYNSKVNSVSYLIPIPFLILFWVYYLEYGTWTYIDSDDIWIKPFLSYFM